MTAADIPGFCARINAATPETCGAAADVPALKLNTGRFVAKFHQRPHTQSPPVSLKSKSNRGSPPGAASDPDVPAFESDAMVPSGPAALTAMTPGNEAGYDGRSIPSLPADAT